MKLLLLVPVIAVIGVNGLSTEKIYNGPQDYDNDLEPLNTPSDNFEDDKEHLDIELQNDQNEKTQPSRDCENNGGSCKNNKPCNGTISMEYTCSKNGVCCIDEGNAKSASELMTQLLSLAITLQEKALQTLTENQNLKIAIDVMKSDLITLQEKAIQTLKENQNLKIAIDVIKSDLTNQGIAIQISQDTIKSDLTNQGIAIQTNQDTIMSNLTRLGDMEINIHNQTNQIEKLDEKLANLTKLTKLINNKVVCPEGFFMLGPPNQCFKLFLDQKCSWFEANSKCESEGLVSAHPSDPVALQRYIVNKYGYDYQRLGDLNTWLPARGSGSKYMTWEGPNGGRITYRNVYWYTTMTRSKTWSTSNCLMMWNYDGAMKAYPGRPYAWGTCSSPWAYTICELIKE